MKKARAKSEKTIFFYQNFIALSTKRAIINNICWGEIHYPNSICVKRVAICMSATNMINYLAKNNYLLTKSLLNAQKKLVFVNTITLHYLSLKDRNHKPIGSCALQEQFSPCKSEGLFPSPCLSLEKQNCTFWR